MNSSTIVFIAYVILLVIGGIIGYTFSQSAASIVASLSAAFLLTIGIFAYTQGYPLGYYLIICTLAALLAFFGFRFYETGRWVPAGAFLLLTIIPLGLIIWEISRRR